MIVTTLADMFEVGRTISTNRSAMLVGSMSDEALMRLSHDRYNSRFGTADVNDPTTPGEGSVFDYEAPKPRRNILTSKGQERRASTSEDQVYV